jgi:hypothetical protein
MYVRACCIQSDSPFTHCTPPTRFRHHVGSPRCLLLVSASTTASTTAALPPPLLTQESGDELARFAAKTLGTALGPQTVSCACRKAKGGQRFGVGCVVWLLYLLKKPQTLINSPMIASFVSRTRALRLQKDMMHFQYIQTNFLTRMIVFTVCSFASGS